MIGMPTSAEVIEDLARKLERARILNHRGGTFPAPWGVQAYTERSEVGANTPLLQSRRQMPKGI